MKNTIEEMALEFGALSRRRADVKDELDDMLSAASASKRDLTAAEARQFDRREADLRELDRQIDALSREPGVLEQTRKVAEPSFRMIPSGGGQRQPEGVLTSANGTGARVLAKGDKLAQGHAPFSAGQLMLAMALGSKNAEVRASLSEGTDSAGGFSVPELIAQQAIDLMRANAVTVQAGASFMALGSDTNHVVRLESDPQFAWRDELAAISESDPTFGRVTLTPRSCAVIVRASRELLADSINAEQMLLTALAEAGARAWDQAALWGSGVAPEPLGVSGTSGVLTVPLAGALASYSPLVQAASKLAQANSRATAAIMHPRDMYTLADLQDTTNQPLMKPGILNDVTLLDTSAAPVDLGAGTDSEILVGDFSKLILGVRSELRIELLRELYAGTHEIGFACHFRFDCAVAWPQAFCKITGVAAPA